MDQIGLCSSQGLIDCKLWPLIEQSRADVCDNTWHELVNSELVEAGSRWALASLEILCTRS